MVLIKGLQQEQSVCRLNPSRTFFGIWIGDTTISAMLGHVDTLGAIYPVKWRIEPLGTRAGLTPSIQDIKRGLFACWEAFRGEEPVQYCKLFLCLPGWACKGTDVLSEVDTSSGASMRFFGRGKVSDAHVRMLENVAGLEQKVSRAAVVDLIPRYFILNGDRDRRVGDPVGEEAAKVALDAYVVTADLNITKEILDFLGDMNIYVDAITSSYAPTSSLLSDEEKARGAVILDVERRNVYCSIYTKGALSATVRVRGGSDDILSKAADALGVSSADLACYVNERRELLQNAGRNNIAELPLFRWRATHPSVRRLEEVAVEPALGICENIRELLETWRGTDDAVLKDAVIIGDDCLAIRVLKDVLRERGGIQCRWEMPSRVHDSEVASIPGLVRVTELLRQCGCAQGPRRRQLFLEEYNESVLNRVFQRMSAKTLRTCREALFFALGARGESAPEERTISEGVLLRSLRKSRYAAHA